jgi:hypothetical protein
VTSPSCERGRPQGQPVVEAHHPARPVDHGHRHEHPVDDAFAEAHERQDREVLVAEARCIEGTARHQDRDASEARDVECQCGSQEHGEKEIDEVVVRQARVHELVEPRGEQRRHDGHAEQVGAEACPGHLSGEAQHGEHERPAEHRKLPAAHQCQRGHHQEPD